jgi:hypothetical protein
MEIPPNLSLVAVLFALTVMINLPFGYFRKRARRFSFKWFLYIHLPVPFIILARTLSHIDLKYIPIFIAAAFIGQLWGGEMEF